MASLLYALNGFDPSGSPLDGFKSYNNDTGVWTNYTGWPNALVGTIDAAKRTQGGWDGTYWYIIGSDLKLYRMHGITRVWSSALLSGVAILPTTMDLHHWTMTSDGRFLYILLDGIDLRRYDPVADTMTVRSAPPLGGAPDSRQCFLAYDGVDTIYARGTDVVNARQVLKYILSTDTWSLLPTVTQVGVSMVWMGAVCLQGKLWFIMEDNNNFLPYSYNPNTNTWSSLLTIYSPGLTPSAGIPYGEDSDATLRFWLNGTLSLIYNVGTDTWSVGSPSTQNYATRQGVNWAITRLFSPLFSFFESDGVTPLAPNFPQGNTVIGQTLQTHIKVQTPSALGSGATVAVVSTVQTDADDVVSISATALGSYTTTFTTGALSAGQMFDVYIKVIPTIAQTAGLTKNWNLRVS